MATPKPETKVCRQCGRELPVSKFGLAPKNHNGLKSYCRDCENENSRKYRERKRAEKPKKQKTDNRIKIMENEIKNNLTDKDPKDIEITTAGVLRFVWWAILLISAVVAVYALIWAEWHTFKVAVTVVFSNLLGTVVGYFMSETLEKVFGDK